MATTITRTTWTNDTGTPSVPVGDGTVLNNARLQDIYAAIDAVLAAAVTIGGVLGSEGFGTHLFSASGTGSNILRVRNTAAGTGNSASMDVGNDTSATAFQMQALSSTFTGNNNVCQLVASIAGGMRLLCSHASGEFSIFTNSTRRITVSPAGLVTLATDTKVDCGFFAYNTADDAGFTAGAFDFDTETYDEGSNFAADTFTAPVTGRYWLSAGVLLTNTAGSAAALGVAIVPSNHANGIYIGWADAVPNNEQRLFSGSIVIDMDAGDTATVNYKGTASSVTVRGSAVAGERITYFCGRRVW